MLSRIPINFLLDFSQDVMVAFMYENTITTPLRTQQAVRVGYHHHEYPDEPLGRVGVHAGLTRQEMALPHASAYLWPLPE
jgi:hypothetical protein